MSPAPKKPAARPKKNEAAAARNEGSGKPHTITVRGIEFELPAEPPFEVILAARAQERANGNAAELYALIDLAEAYVGERAHDLWRGKSASEGSEVLMELLEACDEVYGTDTGESSASSSS